MNFVFLSCLGLWSQSQIQDDEQQRAQTDLLIITVGLSGKVSIMHHNSKHGMGKNAGKKSTANADKA